ncbi:MAG TPA: hypothetical protein VJG32_01340 [Anaerolineae bacterium]|nr:hypothetical protein [Anaerolineae bacterium]
MNRSTSGLLLSKAVNGFLQFKAAEGLSPATLTSYETHLKLWLEHLGDVPLGKITAREVQEHLPGCAPTTSRVACRVATIPWPLRRSATAG